MTVVEESTGERVDILGALTAFAAGLAFEDIPEAVVRRTKLVLRHNLMVMIAARRDPIPGQDRTAWPVALPQAARAVRVTDGLFAPAELAIVTNALAMGARAQHDEHQGSVSHLGSTTVPPLLAAAAFSGANGRTVLRAMIAGYEVAGRIGELSVGETAARGFRPTGLYGPFSGAIASGLALGLDGDTLLSAAAIAAGTSAGFTQAWIAGTDEWRYHTAFASRNGYAAARLAQQGVRGAPDALYGVKGFHRAFGGPHEVEDAELSDLGTRWALDDVLLKPYPVCAFNQSAVQQTLRLTSEHGVAGEDVERVVVRMNDIDLQYPGVDTLAEITTRAQALMCLRTSIATALADGDVAVEALDMHDRPLVRDLRRRIATDPDATIPTHTSAIDVVLRDGTTLTSGAAQHVLYDDAVAAQMLERLMPVGHPDRSLADRLAVAVEGLDQEGAVGDLLAGLPLGP
jgi:2-methylcitrate dehydratase PrpD